MRRRAKPSSPAKRLTVSIGEIGARGDGVAHADGREIFVPLTAPGDVALIEARGERGCLIELIEQSPNRAPPPCPHYGACGGCALQHVDEVFYRAWKRERVIEALARAGLGDVPVNDLVATPPATRRRATFAVRRLKGGVVLGFNERQSSNIVDLKKCLILHPDLLARLGGLRALAVSLGAPSFDLAVTLCRNGLDIDITGARMEEPRGAALLKITDAATAAGCVRICINGEALITFEPPLIDFDGVAVTPPPGAFLQASKEGEAALIGLVRKGVGGARKICDLFAGCGSFALPLARSASLSAYDSDAGAIGALSVGAANAQRAGLAINPVRAEARDLFERPLQADELSSFDAAVFDPPRAGARAQAETLAASRVPLVIGVSCNPATFARDAALLVAGGYRLQEVTPVDQFVYSSHVELVGVFRKG